MTTPLGLAERVKALEYAVFEQFPDRTTAMDRAAAQTSAETAANGEAIARRRVDMAALQAAINLQRDRLRTELYLGTAYFHRDMTGFREAVSMRLPKADGQFNGLRADMDQRFEALASIVQAA